MIHYPIPPETVIVDSVMATFVCAMGDSRYYCRHLFPPSVRNQVSGLMEDLTVQHILDLGNQIENATESKVMAITLSLYFDDNEDNIPAGDAQVEKSAYVLIRCKADGDGKKETFQLRIPNVDPVVTNLYSWFETAKSFIYGPLFGEPADKITAINMKDDRRARGSV